MNDVTHISVPVESALTTLRSQIVPSVADTKRTPSRLVQAESYFRHFESQDFPDTGIGLAQLRATDDDLIEVPHVGCLALNDWSRRQCASLLGLRWDRWFSNASGAERAEELNRRFRRARERILVRATRLHPDDSKSDGTIRAFVTSGYTAIPDSMLAGELFQHLSRHDHELKIIRFDMTERSTTYIVKIGDAFRPADQPEIGDIWGGILVRNSSVGFASLELSLHLTRLICKNGMVAPIGEPRVFRKRHRYINTNDLLGTIKDRLAELPGRVNRGFKALSDAHRRDVTNVRTEVEDLLRKANLPIRLVPSVLAAYEKEPMATVFGVSQALTLAAQDLPPEERLELERLAGTYVSAVSEMIS